MWPKKNSANTKGVHRRTLPREFLTNAVTGDLAHGFQKFWYQITVAGQRRDFTELRW